MSMDVKYIVIDHHLTGAAMILFPNFMTHAEVAFSLEGHGKPLSAGFVRPCQAREGQFQCYGDSISLKLKRRPEDTDILQRMLSGGRDV